MDTLVTILIWVLVGGVAGLIASKITGTDREVSGWVNVLVGVVGAFIGGTLLTLVTTGRFDLNGDASISFVSVLVAIAGASLLLWALKRSGNVNRLPGNRG